MSATRAPLVVGPGEGRVELKFGRPMFKLGVAQGSDGLGLLEAIVPAGGGFRIPHWHEDLDEAFYVLEGEIEYLLGDEWQRATAGTTVFVPAGCVHAWRNDSAHPARELVMGSSGEMNELIRSLGTTAPERWDSVLAQHRTHIAHDSPHMP
jgi:uncharacterized cupin superfamily protein